MKKTRKSSHKANQGYALLITVVFIGIALLLLASVMDWTSSSAKQATMNSQIMRLSGSCKCSIMAQPQWKVRRAMG